MEDNMNNTGVNENENNENQQETKTYSAEEVAKLIQAEADRRTNQALAKQKKEYEKKLQVAVEAKTHFHLWMSSSAKRLRHR